jgi:hypothetical protein
MELSQMNESRLDTLILMSPLIFGAVIGLVWLTVTALNLVGGGLVDALRDKLSYNHEYRMRKLDLRATQRQPTIAAQPQDAYLPDGQRVRIVANVVFIYGDHGDMVALEPAEARQWLRKAIKYQRDAGFDDAVMAWAVRHPTVKHPTVKQLPSGRA